MAWTRTMGRPMENAGWCRAVAQDCMRLAQAARTAQMRQELLASALSWWRLANEPAGYSDLPPGDGRHVEVAAGEAGDGRRRHA